MTNVIKQHPREYGGRRTPDAQTITVTFTVDPETWNAFRDIAAMREPYTAKALLQKVIAETVNNTKEQKHDDHTDYTGIR